jgi:hypothetical protein
MNRFRFFWLGCLGLMASLTACEQALIPPSASDDPEAIFEQAWTVADREYAFFAYKGIDWDQSYARYRPRVTPETGPVELFDLLDSMLFELRDGHVNLRSPFDLSRNWNWYLNSPSNFDYDLLERNYFQQRERYIGPFVVAGLPDSIGYVYYSAFSRGFSNRDIDLIVAIFENAKGLIIDIRDNGGGSVENARRLAGRFLTEERVVGRQRYKSGPGHEDFTEFEDIVLEPAGDTAFTKPVVLLTNRSSYSAANLFTLYMRDLPQVTHLGDTTGGGGGLPASTELANGWFLRVSSSQLIAPDGFNVEDGIPPDLQVDLSPTDRNNGTDTMLERALEVLR